MKGPIRWLADYFGVQVSRYHEDIHETAFATLRPVGESRGNVLLAYIVQPFLERANGVANTQSNSHTHFGETRLIAQTFLDLGYSVDAISYRNPDFEPQKEYAVFVSARTHLHRLAPRLNTACVKIAHLDTCHWVFNNHAAYQRLLALRDRRGVSVNSLRIIEPNWALEAADAGIVLGNDFTLNTYRYARKPLYRLSVPTVHVYPWSDDKDFEVARRRFLWFGSHGLVHKGLDLVLEAFAGLPDLHLTVCGPLHGDPDFVRAYERELYHTANIHTLGWVDVSSPEFTRVMQQCGSIIFPSCAEANVGSVVTCMQAGLIPVISEACGIDVEDFGTLLPDCSVESIRAAACALAEQPADQVEAQARRTWAFARAHNTAERYAADHRRIIQQILEPAPSLPEGMTVEGQVRE
ncbi:MAG: glycosyltransferase [Anaerolineales bacterium]